MCICDYYDDRVRCETGKQLQLLEIEKCEAYGRALNTRSEETKAAQEEYIKAMHKHKEHIEQVTEA